MQCLVKLRFRQLLSYRSGLGNADFDVDAWEQIQFPSQRFFLETRRDLC